MSDFIVSEDKDLLRIGEFGNARIVNINEFLRVGFTRERSDRPERQ